MYFSGQGKLFIASRDSNGNAGAFRYVGNVSDFKPQLATTTIEHKESTSGQRLTDLRLTTEKKANVDAVLDDFDKNNLGLALYSTPSTVSGSSVTAEVLPSALAVGDYARLKYPEVSAVVVKDSAGTPATLVLGTDYEISSANHGTIKILSLGAYTQPFKVDYTYAAHDNVVMFNAAPAERWLRFEGINTADGDKPVLVELYRVLLDPLKELALISDDIGALNLSGSVLYDDKKVSDSYLGQFGRFVHI
jgi:hypothetical protein